MRTLLKIIALIATLRTQAGAGEKKYTSKEREGISKTIDFLLSLTREMWDRLKENLDNDKAAIELSWAVNMEANYTTIYTAFCEENK